MEAVIRTLMQNVATAREVLRRLIPAVRPPRACGCPRLLEHAVITSPKAFPPATRRRLDLLLGRYFAQPRRRGGRARA